MTTHRPLLMREKILLIAVCILLLLASRIFAATDGIFAAPVRNDSAGCALGTPAAESEAA